MTPEPELRSIINRDARHETTSSSSALIPGVRRLDTPRHAWICSLEVASVPLPLPHTPAPSNRSFHSDRLIFAGMYALGRYLLHSDSQVRMGLPQSPSAYSLGAKKEETTPEGLYFGFYFKPKKHFYFKPKNQILSKFIPRQDRPNPELPGPAAFLPNLNAGCPQYSCAALKSMHVLVTVARQRMASEHSGTDTRARAVPVTQLESPSWPP
jgi:hypothetical protein